MYPGVAEDSAYKRLLAEHVFALLERYCYGIGETAADSKAQKDDEVMRPDVFKLTELCDLGLQTVFTNMIGHENDGVVPTWIATRREQLRVSPVAVLNLCKDIGIVPSIVAGTVVNRACEKASRKGASSSVRHDGNLNFPEFLEAACYVANNAFAKDKECTDARDRLFAFLNRLNGSYGFEFNAKLRE